MQVHPDGSSVRNIFEGSFTEEGTESGKVIFGEGFKLAASEERKKFDSTCSADWGGIEDQYSSDQGVIGEQAIKRLLVIYEK